MTEAVENGLDGFGADTVRAVELASAEARSLGAIRMGTEHLLLGLLGHPEGGAARLLSAAGVTLAAARRKVAEAVGQRDEEPGTVRRPDPDTVGVLERSPRAERAIGRAFRFSRERHAPEVTTEHLLLGVLDVEGTAGQVLRGLVIDLDALRAAVESAREDDRGEVAATGSPEAESNGAPAHTGVVCASCSSPLEDSLDYSVLSATPTAEGGRRREVTVVSCRRCGAAVGIAR